MKHIFLILFTAISIATFGQTAPMVNNIPWYEYSKKLSVGKFMLKSAGEYDTSFTIPANTASITLDTISADKTVTFTDGSAYDRGVIMYVQNANSSAFVWNVAGNVKEADGTVISNLPRGLHIFYWNSNAWIRLSTSGGSSPTVDTLTFTSPLVQLDKNVSLDFDAFPQDTVGVVEHNDSLFNILYSHTGVRDSTFIVLLTAGGGVSLGVRAKDTLGVSVSTYPAGVYDDAGSFIGVAYDQNEAVSIWNADASNASIGVLSSGNGPFNFSCTGSITKVTLQPQTVIGTIFFDDFNRGYWGSNYDTASLTSASTWKTSSVRLNSTSNTYAFDKIVKYIGAGKLTSRNISVEIGWKPSYLTGTVYGPTVGLFSTRNPGQNTSTLIYNNLSSGAQAYGIAGASSTGATTIKASTSNSFYDAYYKTILDISEDTATAYIDRRDTSQTTSIRYIYDFKNTTQTATKPNIFYPAFGINTNTDSVEIDYFRVYSKDRRYIKYLFVGNSITTGYYGGHASNGFPDQLKSRTKYDIQTLAGGYNRTADVIDNLTQIIDMKPEYVFLEIGTNDRGAGVTQATIHANIDTINNRLNRAGIKVYHLAAPDAGNPVTASTTNKYLSDTYGAFFVDNWTGCYAVSEMVDAYHPTEKGFKTIADTIAAKLPLLFTLSGKSNGLPSYDAATGSSTTPTLDQVLSVGNTSATKIDITGFKTTNSGLAVGSIEVQPYALNNNWISENLYFNGGFKYRATGYGSLIQFYNGQTLFNNFTTKSAGTTAIAADFTLSFKNDYFGNVAIGGNISSSYNVFTGAKALVRSTGVSNIDGTLHIGGVVTTATATGAALDVTGLTVMQGVTFGYVAKSGNYTLTATDYGIELTATGLTATLPTAVSVPGRTYVIKLTASGTGTVATTSSQTIDGSITYSLSAQYKYVSVQSNGANWIIIGNN